MKLIVQGVGDMNSCDLNEIARLIREGYTSGLLDPEGGRHIAWELKANEWEDEDETDDERA